MIMTIIAIIMITAFKYLKGSHTALLSIISSKEELTAQIVRKWSKVLHKVEYIFSTEGLQAEVG